MKGKDSFYVHVMLPDGTTVLAGQCIRDASMGQGAFKYSQEYLNHDQAFPIDPLNLPLENKVFKMPYNRENQGIPKAILDAGPDDWGKTVLVAIRKPPPTNEAEFLVAGSGTGVGALRFTSSKTEKPVDVAPRPFDSVETLVTLSEMIDQKVPIHGEAAMFLRRGAAVGGARPKSLIEHEGAEWLIKFPRNGDLFDNPLAEYCTMQMAKKAGLDIPDMKLLSLAQGNAVMVKRFDDVGAQHHMTSMYSLINSAGFSGQTEAEYSYKNMLDLANSLTSGGDNNADEMFKRMVFNIATGNTDDHAKNHAVLRDGNTGEYRLSPVYDLVPDPSLIGAHAMAIGPFGSNVNAENIKAAATQFGISEERTTEIVRDVLHATAAWEVDFADGGMSQRDIDYLRQAMTHGRGVLETLVPTCAVTPKDIKNYVDSLPDTQGASQTTGPKL